MAVAIALRGDRGLKRAYTLSAIQVLSSDCPSGRSRIETELKNCSIFISFRVAIALRGDRGLKPRSTALIKAATK